MVSQFSTHQMTVVQVACECRGEQIVEQHMFSVQVNEALYKVRAVLERRGLPQHTAPICAYFYSY